MTTFVVGLLLKTVDANFSFQGYALLAAFAALGAFLQVIPQRSRTWEAPASSAAARMKQSLGTLRTVIAMILVVVPLAILTTNDKWLGKVPGQFDSYVSGLASSGHDKDWLWLNLQDQTKSQKYLYVGELELTPTPDSSAPTSGSAPKSSPALPRMRVMETDKVIGFIAQKWVGDFYGIAWGICFLAIIFCLALYFAEMMSDMVFERSVNPRRR